MGGKRPLCTDGGNVNKYRHYRKHMEVPHKTKNTTTIWFSNSTPGYIPEEKGSTNIGGISYISDVKDCSSSEKKAIAYLYEQDIVSGYQIAGQTFFPSQNLKTKEGAVWIEKIKQCWKW